MVIPVIRHLDVLSTQRLVSDCVRAESLPSIISMARQSLSLGRGSLDQTPSEVLSVASENGLGTNPNAIAYLVYAKRGDPFSAGFKTPTTRDIPQIKLPRVEHSSDDNLEAYLRHIRDLENLVGNKLVDGQLSLTSHQDEYKSEADLPRLSSIPEAFFAEEFRLDNPRVFDVVIGEEDPNLIQEKLSWYVDIVEAHLAREIARASTQFFAATAQFGAIQEQATQTSLKIDDFLKIAAGQHLVLDHYNETIYLQHKLEDARTLCRGMGLLDSLKRKVDELEGLVHMSLAKHANEPDEIKTCLNALTSLQKFIADASIMDLSRVKAALPFIERVEIVKNKLKSQFANLFVAAMTSSLQRARQSNTGQNDDLQKFAETALEAAKTLNSSEAALKLYQAEVDREIKQILRRNRPEFSTEQGSEDSQALARSLHALSAEDADEMCRNLFKQLPDLFRALQGQIKTDAGNAFLEAAVRSADNRLARILRVRKDPATSLPPTAFVRFYRQVIEFCNYCSEVTSGSVPAKELEEFMLAQTKLYIHNMNAQMETELIAEVESDDWRRADILPSVQAAVDKISKAGLSDLKSWDTSSSGEQNFKQRVEFESQTFVVSKSATGVATRLVQYLQLVSSLSRVYSIALGLGIAELLKLFSQKAHHQILGFRATRTAGLKHISVKNLVLCYESLRFIESLLEDIKRCLSRHLPLPDGATAASFSGDLSISTEILSSFDSVQQCYFDHRSEIHQKLVKLMSDKVLAYSRHIGITDWSQTVPQANKYMLDLIRQTTTVVHIAQEMLPPSVSLKLVQEIYGAYKPKLLEAYANVHVETVAEKRNVLRDLAYFRAKSEPLRGSGNTGDVIYESVNGFVAPELSAEPDTISSSRLSLEMPRKSMDDGDAAALAIEPGPDEIVSEHAKSLSSPAQPEQPVKLLNTSTGDRSARLTSDVIEPISSPEKSMGFLNSHPEEAARREETPIAEGANAVSKEIPQPEPEYRETILSPESEQNVESEVLETDMSEDHKPLRELGKQPEARKLPEDSEFENEPELIHSESSASGQEPEQKLSESMEQFQNKATVSGNKENEPEMESQPNNKVKKRPAHKKKKK